jgi:hypothetical protein
MSNKSFFIESGLIMLWIPVGLLFIVLLVGGLFMMAKDTPSPHQLSSAAYVG